MPGSAMAFVTRVTTTIILVVVGFTAWDINRAVQRLTRGTADHSGGSVGPTRATSGSGETSDVAALPQAGQTDRKPLAAARLAPAFH